MLVLYPSQLFIFSPALKTKSVSMRSTSVGEWLDLRCYRAARAPSAFSTPTIVPFVLRDRSISDPADRLAALHDRLWKGCVRCRSKSCAPWPALTSTFVRPRPPGLAACDIALPLLLQFGFSPCDMSVRAWTPLYIKQYIWKAAALYVELKWPWVTGVMILLRSYG